MTYSIKEIFYTLQGEGAHAGRPAVFCRFSGCNLWTGRESDRASAVCTFCDTDFVGTDGERGGKFPDPAALAAEIDSLWPASYPASKYVVFTGGEPLLQLDAALIDGDARGRLRDRHRNQRHLAGAGRGRLDLRQPEDGLDAGGRQRATKSRS